MLTKKISQYLIVLLLGITAFSSGVALAQTDESKVKALWVHTLISYIKWNDNNDNSNTTICTRGIDRTYQFLKEIQNEKKTKYKLIETGTHSDLIQCNLLYIATSERNNISSILDNIENKNIVTVSDIKGFAQDGGVIELVHNQDAVKLKINVKSAKKANVVINSDLLAVSTVINK